ncbi:MAG TPA: response regulator [Chitinophagaceae bacterium]|nr:response regulator [Chitinophagaceae bacterium]
MKRILVVDDNADILDVVRIFLESNGYEVLTVSKGDNILNDVVNYSPQIILLDVYLRGSNGVEICNNLKSNSSTKHIPIIMFSAQTSDYLILRKCAADDFIPKPFDEKVLIEKISNLLITPNLKDDEGVWA